MRLIKRIFVLLFFILMSIQFQWACDEDKKDTGVLNAPINDPKNDYQVVVEIISFGGLNGCAAGFIERNSEPVTNATIKVNEVPFYNDTTSIFTNLYADTLNALNYNYFTRYNLIVEHDGKLVARGQADMPSLPVVENLSNPVQHGLNKALTVKWKKVERATAIQVIVSGYVYNPVIKDTVERSFNSGLLKPTTTQITVPDTLFKLPGTYVLGILAINGINAGTYSFQLYDEEGKFYKSFNMEGAAGIFLAAMAYPDPVGIKIIVPEPAGQNSLARPAISPPRLQDMVVKTLTNLTRQVLNKK